LPQRLFKGALDELDAELFFTREMRRFKNRFAVQVSNAAFRGRFYIERLSCELEVLIRKNKTKAQCKLILHRSMGRYVKELKSGKLKIDNAKVAQDEKLDGKYLLSTSDQHLSAEDIALGYKQLLEVERAFRTLKSTLCLRPVYHSKDDRIRSHVLLRLPKGF
jgi:transposase